MLWTNARWGWGVNAEERYLWLSLFSDHDSIVSRVDSHIDFFNVQALSGLRFGGLAGHKYQGIDELVLDKKNCTRR